MRLRKTLITFAVFVVSITVLVSGSIVGSWPGVVCVIAASLTTCGSAIRLSEQFVPKHRARQRSIV